VAEFDFCSLQIVADPDNIPSRQMAARNGFEEIGEQDGRILYTLEVRGRGASNR
jgi:RimJ/RimL family protein N-acetyltransferase